jgi:hypothetical protein
MRGVRWLTAILLVVLCLPLLGCSKDSGAPPTPDTGSPTEPYRNTNDK